MSKLNMRTLTGGQEEMRMLQALLEAAPSYHHKIMGQPARPAEAQSNFTILPPKKT